MKKIGRKKGNILGNMNSAKDQSNESDKRKYHCLQSLRYLPLVELIGLRGTLCSRRV